MRAILVVSSALLGCGRLGFDPQGDAGAANVDAPQIDGGSPNACEVVTTDAAGYIFVVYNRELWAIACA